MSLTNVWVQTLGDGLVRADQIVGIDAHQTPALSGKPSRWLLDVILPTSAGSGSREGWTVTVLHRTLIQTSEDLGAAPAALARLIAQLDQINAAGVITTSREDTRPERADAAGSRAPSGESGGEFVAGSTPVRFRFVTFTAPTTERHTDAEYL